MSVRNLLCTSFVVLRDTPGPSNVSPLTEDKSSRDFGSSVFSWIVMMTVVYQRGKYAIGRPFSHHSIPEMLTQTDERV